MLLREVDCETCQWIPVATVEDGMRVVSILKFRMEW